MTNPRLWFRAYSRRRRAEARAKGLCVTCWRRKARKGFDRRGVPFSRCEPCIARAARHNVVYRSKALRQGRCVDCGRKKPRKERRWLCARCRRENNTYQRQYYATRGRRLRKGSNAWRTAA